MVEQTHTGEAHDHAVLVGSLDDVVIADGATGLGDVLHAGGKAPLDGGREGEKRSGAQGHIPAGGQPGLLVPLGEPFGLLGEVVLPDALGYIEKCDIPVVVKADGLALGKGVIIAQTRDEAREAVRSMMEDKIFGDSGNCVVVEEFLTGPEVSVLSFTAGETVVPMVSSMDHKRVGDNDTGLNTGGMGTIAPNPCYTEAIADECMEKIFLPTIRAMKAENRTFKGCLYFGLMLTEKGPKVIEYNCRFGDPETQVVLPLLKSDLLTVMQAVTNEPLAETPVEFADESACCVVMASGGYPGKYPTGFPITMKGDAAEHTYVAGAKLDNGVMVTGGGRVLGVTATAPTLKEAIEKAYSRVDNVSFEGAYYRHDIGARALRELEK